jgi:cleavage and polyadenylation specificity factor subunit 2
VFRSSSDTLAGDLIANGGGRVITMEVKRRIKLTGAELEEFRIKVGEIL